MNETSATEPHSFPLLDTRNLNVLKQGSNVLEILAQADSSPATLFFTERVTASLRSSCQRAVTHASNYVGA